MKQTATRRNKTEAAEHNQRNRASQPRRGFLRPPGLPPNIRAPRTRSQYDFIDHWIKTKKVKESALAAGYNEVWASKHAYEVLKEYGAYIAYLEDKVIENRAKLLALDTQSVLDEIARIGMINEYDYLVIEMVDKKINGQIQKVPQARRKELHELSRDEMVGIKIVRGSDGKLTYDLRDKDPMLLALGKNLGLFNEKLIIERRNYSLSAKMDLSNVPTDTLKEIIQSFEGVAQKHGHGRIIEAK